MNPISAIFQVIVGICQILQRNVNALEELSRAGEQRARAYRKDSKYAIETDRLERVRLLNKRRKKLGLPPIEEDSVKTKQSKSISLD